MGVSCWAAGSPSPEVRGLALGAPAATLPLLSITKSLLLLLVAMLRCLDPKEENDMTWNKWLLTQAGKYVVVKTGKILKSRSLEIRVLTGVVGE